MSRRRGVVPQDRRAVVLEATADGAQVVRAVMDGIEHQREALADLFAEVAVWRRPPVGPDLSHVFANRDR